VDDVELVERVRGGDDSAFGLLVARHRQAAVRAAMAALGSAAEAEDVAQDAFLLAFQRIASFRGESSFKTWLMTIVWRLALNRRRGFGWRLRVFLEPEDQRWVVPDQSASPEEHVSSDQMRRDVRRLIRALPPKLRDALLLSLSETVTVDEASAMLGIPSGTIKSRAASARQRLRQQLTRLGYGES
jgi:RNA polymerase sigma-70 factor (ECF subfamily)